MAVLYDAQGSAVKALGVSDLAVTNTGAANAAVTATLPAAGTGLFHYVTSITVQRASTALLAGTAALVVTSTNLPGNPAWTVGNAMLAGDSKADVNLSLTGNPLKSSVANTATTVVCPAPGAGVLWRVNVTYYVGP